MKNLLFTVKEAARAAGIAPSSLSRILQGHHRPSVSTAKRLELATGIPAPEWIFSPPEEVRERFFALRYSGAPGRAE